MCGVTRNWAFGPSVSARRASHDVCIVNWDELKCFFAKHNVVISNICI